MTDAEILLRAAALLEQYGWIQHDFAVGRSCDAYAAIYHFARERTPRVVRHIEKVVGEPIIVWNDRPQQTQQNVTRTLRAAAQGSPQ